MATFFKIIFGSFIFFLLFLFSLLLLLNEYLLGALISGIATIVFYKRYFREKKKANSQSPTISNKNNKVLSIGKYNYGTKCFVEVPVKRASGEGLIGIIFSNKYVIRFKIELRGSFYDSENKVRYEAYCYDADFGTPGSWASFNQLNGFDSAQKSAERSIQKGLHKEMFPLETDLKFK